MAKRYGDRIEFLKLNRGENRSIMKALELHGVPTIIFMYEKSEFAGRLVGDEEATAANIEKNVLKVLNAI